MSTKGYNPVYTSFIGGYSAEYSSNGEKRKNGYQYTCLWGKFRFTKDTTCLKDGWIHRSLHWNNVNSGGKAWDFHIAYRMRFPFIKIGFNSIKDLFNN